MSQPTERAKGLVVDYFGAWSAIMSAGLGPTEDTAIILRALASVAFRSHHKIPFDPNETVTDNIQREIDALESAPVTSPPTHDTPETTTA